MNNRFTTSNIPLDWSKVKHGITYCYFICSDKSKMDRLIKSGLVCPHILKQGTKSQFKINFSFSQN